MAIGQLTQDIVDAIDTAKDKTEAAITAAQSAIASLQSEIESEAFFASWRLREIDVADTPMFDVTGLINELANSGGDFPKWNGTIQPPDGNGLLDGIGTPPPPQFPQFIQQSLSQLPSEPQAPSKPNFLNFQSPSLIEASIPTAPVIGDIRSIDAPVLTLPDLTLPDVVINPFTGILDIEQFTYDFPASAEVTAAIPSFVYNAATYDDNLEQYAAAWVKRMLDAPDGGLSAVIEEAIFDRAISREVLTAQANIELAADEFSAAGWPLPPGMLRARMRAIANELQNRTEDLNRKIMEDQGRLALANTQFAVEQIPKIAALLQAIFNAVEDRLLSAARSHVELAVAVYNAKVGNFNLELEKYKTFASVHESNQRLALLEVEKYNAYLRGKEIEGRLRMQDVEVFKARVLVQETIARLYGLEIEGVKLTADIERLKLERFKGQVDVVIAQQKINESKAQIYQLQIASRTADISAYNAEIGAYEAEVGGYKAVVSARVAELQGRIEAEKAKVSEAQLRNQEYEAKISLFRAQLDGTLAAFKAQADGAKIVAEVDLESFKSEVEAYKGDISKAEAVAKLGVSAAQVQFTANVAAVESQNQAFRLEAEQARLTSETKMRALSEAMKTQSDIISTWLGRDSYITQASGQVITNEAG